MIEKTLILSNIDDRLRTIEKEGCPNGKVREEKVSGIEKILGEIKVTVNDTNNMIKWGILIIIILAFLAGIQCFKDIISLLGLVVKVG
jgi:uncharacterized membrane protein